MMFSRLSAIWLKSSNQRKLMCRSRLHSPLFNIYGFTLQLAELSTFITGYEPRLQFAISLTAEQISRVQFQQAIIQVEEWFSSLKSKSSQQLVCHLWVTELLQQAVNQNKSSTEGQEPRNVEVRWSKSSKQDAELAKHKPKQWQKVTQKKGKKTGQPRELKHKKRRKGTTWMQAEAQD